MLNRLFPKQRDFFPSFERISLCLTQTVAELLAFVEDPSKTKSAISKTRRMEEETTELVRESVAHLHQTYITPFDRVHIFQFVVKLREISRLVTTLAERMIAYEIKDLPVEALEIALKCGESCSVLAKMVSQLSNIKEPGIALTLCTQMYRLKADTQGVYFKASREFFNNDHDLKEAIKIKEVNEDLLKIMDKFTEISLLIEEIILEHA